jgi:hypothetical protein
MTIDLQRMPRSFTGTSDRLIPPASIPAIRQRRCRRRSRGAAGRGRQTLRSISRSVCCCGHRPHLRGASLPQLSPLVFGIDFIGCGPVLKRVQRLLSMCCDGVVVVRPLLAQVEGLNRFVVLFFTMTHPTAFKA